MKISGSLVLKPGREKPIHRRHPWIFSGAVAEVSGNPKAGDIVAIHAHEGEFLAFAGYSPHSQIRARIWSWDPDETIDENLVARLLEKSIARRDPLFAAKGEMPTAYRLVHAESDGIPGLVVDRYQDTVVVQFLSATIDPWREQIADMLLDLADADHIFERSDVDVRELERLPPRIGPMRGSSPPTRIEIEENRLKFLVDVINGHKTGFYLDQRENRGVVQQLARSRRTLDCFCYTGGFSLAALAGGALQVTAVDSSASVLELGRENLLRNNLAQDRIEWLVGDVFQVLRKFRDRGQDFDLILLDPPKFAPTSAQVHSAARGYKDINLLALKLLAPGGFLVTFSCSGGISPELFQKIVAGAALDAGVDAWIIGQLHQAADHPVALNFPEGSYLKGLICHIG